MNNIIKIYQHTGKCDEQQNLKDILDASMVSTPEEITDESPSLPMTQNNSKNQVLLNHCAFSPTYLILKRKQQNIVLELKNKNAEPLNLVIVCGPINQDEKGIQK